MAGTSFNIVLYNIIIPICVIGGTKMGLDDEKLEPILFFTTRIILSGVFLWAALDKTFGLRFTTQPEAAWLFGFGDGSPTERFLKFGTTNSPLHGVFKAMGGNPLVDWLFMIGLYGIGLSLLLGTARKIAGYGGALLMFLMWLAVAPWMGRDVEYNPIFDDHLVYGAFLLLFAHASNIGWRLSQSVPKWAEIEEKYPFLK